MSAAESDSSIGNETTHEPPALHKSESSVTISHRPSSVDAARVIKHQHHSRSTSTHSSGGGGGVCSGGDGGGAVGAGAGGGGSCGVRGTRENSVTSANASPPSRKVSGEKKERSASASTEATPPAGGKPSIERKLSTDVKASTDGNISSVDTVAPGAGGPGIQDGQLKVTPPKYLSTWCVDSNVLRASGGVEVRGNEEATLVTRKHVGHEGESGSYSHERER